MYVEISGIVERDVGWFAERRVVLILINFALCIRDAEAKGGGRREEVGKW